MRDIPEWLKPKEELDKTFYDVVYYRSNPFGFHDEPFEPHVKATRSDNHVAQIPHVCNIGVNICARVAAENEEEAIKSFWHQYDVYHHNFY